MTYVSESGHWYTVTGKPMYEVKGANGNMRPTTLRDARKLNLAPSVTAIIKMAAAPGLEIWKANQLLMAGLTLSRLPNEPESAWLDRVRTDSTEQARKAAERGTALHASLQGHFEGTPPPENHWPHVQAVKDMLAMTFDGCKWIAEQSFAHPLGFGGKSDLHSDTAVLDFKTKEFSKSNLPGIWDDHMMQLAAYRMGLGIPDARGAIVFVSVTVPGLVHVAELTPVQLSKGWECFSALLKFWQSKHDYRPVFEMEAA